MRDEAEVVRVDVRVGAAANAIRPGIINIEVEKISSCQLICSWAPLSLRTLMMIHFSDRPAVEMKGRKYRPKKPP